VICLEAGALDARIDGVAFLDRRWPAGSLLTREPHRVEGLLHLYPGDLLAVPAEAVFTARNPGEGPAVALEVSLKLPVLLTPMTDWSSTGPSTGNVHAERLAASIAIAPGVSAVVSVGRVILPPQGSVAADTGAGPVLFIVERGRANATEAGLEVERGPGDVELVPRGALAAIHSAGERPLAVLRLTITPTESAETAV